MRPRIVPLSESAKLFRLSVSLQAEALKPDFFPSPVGHTTCGGCVHWPKELASSVVFVQYQKNLKGEGTNTKSCSDFTHIFPKLEGGNGFFLLKINRNVEF